MDLRYFRIMKAQYLQRLRGGAIIKGKRYQRIKKKKLNIKRVVTLLSILIVIVYILNTFNIEETESVVETVGEYKINEEMGEKIITTIEPTEDDKIKESIQKKLAKKDFKLEGQ